LPSITLDRPGDDLPRACRLGYIARIGVAAFLLNPTF